MRLKKIAFFFILISFTQVAVAQTSAPKTTLERPQNLSDSALLTLVQQQTFKYFWNFAHPVSGLARERSNVSPYYGTEVVTTGGTGFGVMALVVATQRKFIERDTASKFLLKMLKFLAKADSYHGVFPHWLNGSTGKTIPFSRKDDGADLVETSFLFQGLLTARQYFSADNKIEIEIRNRINRLWNEVEWDFFTKNHQDVLYWHWSPNNGWSMNFPIRGFNECLITYVLAASSSSYPVPASVYHKGWVQSNFFKNGKVFYNDTLPLGFDYGGPLFFSQYSFLGLDPRGLSDAYANYWQQNLNHSRINYHYCVDNPMAFKGYSSNSWGLSAGDTYNGYNAHSPTNDKGTITITAALSAFPYTPKESMQALKHFYFDMGQKLWSAYGFVDGFNETQHWVANSHLAIDQGPIIVMIENYRSGLLWNLFMSCKEVQNGLVKLGFRSVQHPLNSSLSLTKP